MTDFPDATTVSAGPASPLDALVDQVGQAWADVLDLDTVPVDVNFFDAGGDSLLLILLLDQLRELTNRELAAADLFQYSTVRTQAALLAGSADAPTPTLTVLGARDRGRLVGRARRGGATA